MASELTLRIMKRIVDKKLGPSSEPKRARTPSQALHLSKDEENSLKQLIKQGNDNGSSAGRTNGGATSKSRTVEDFAASYNKGSAGGTRPQQRGPVSKSQKMNLSDFVQAKKK